jgi:hypothetical protein
MFHSLDWQGQYDIAFRKLKTALPLLNQLVVNFYTSPDLIRSFLRVFPNARSLVTAGSFLSALEDATGDEDFHVGPNHQAVAA